MGSERQSLSYVEVHAYFKSLLFMLCGWAIHSNYVQYVVSSYNYLLLGSSVFWCSCVMCGLPFFSVARVKDVLLLGGCFIVFYLIFMAYAYRTDVENNEVGRAACDDPCTSDVGGVRHREQEEVS